MCERQRFSCRTVPDLAWREVRDLWWAVVDRCGPLWRVCGGFVDGYAAPLARRKLLQRKHLQARFPPPVDGVVGFLPLFLYIHTPFPFLPILFFLMRKEC